MVFQATTDSKTPISMTNHAFWNLSGNCKRNIKSHFMTMSCDHYLPVDKTLIPIGEIANVAGTPFDFTSEKMVGDAIDAIEHNGVWGIDHCFVVRRNENDTLSHVATVHDRESRRRLRVFSNQDGVQVYTGNFMPNDLSSFPFCQHQAMCLENQGFPDAINQP